MGSILAGIIAVALVALGAHAMLDGYFPLAADHLAQQRQVFPGRDQGFAARAARRRHRRGGLPA